MSGTGDSGGGRRLIDGAAKAAFLKVLRGGARLQEAADAVGFSLLGLYGARQRDPAFKVEWKEALAASADADRDARAAPEAARP
jgi:hypothetical protein